MWLVKAGFGAVKTPYEYGPMIAWARKYRMISMVHTGGSSIPGSSGIWADHLIKIQPDVSFHVNGGPVAMPDEDFPRIVNESKIALQVCTAGNLRTTLLLWQLVKKAEQIDRFLQNLPHLRERSTRKQVCSVENHLQMARLHFIKEAASFFCRIDYITYLRFEAKGHIRVFGNCQRLAKGLCQIPPGFRGRIVWMMTPHVLAIMRLQILVTDGKRADGDARVHSADIFLKGGDLRLADLI